MSFDNMDQEGINNQCLLNCQNLAQIGRRIRELETIIDSLNKTNEDLIARMGELERRLNDQTH